MWTFFKKRRNKTFYITALAQVLVTAQLILTIFGYGELITLAMQNNILAAANALTGLLALFGVLNNPTESGVKDKIE